MQKLKIQSSPGVDAVLEAYPETVRPKMEALRTLVVETAEAMGSVAELEETLKWGEPSYIAKKGSTLRMDWKPKAPNQYALYFSCSTQLVPTFRTIFKNVLTFEGNRAIVLQLDEDIPVEILKICIATTLQYHSVKNKPFLGIDPM